MSVKDFFLKKMMQSQMKDVPVEEQEKVFAMIEKNPELFTKIGTEVQAVMASGKDQMTAVMEVIQRYQGELGDLNNRTSKSGDLRR